MDPSKAIVQRYLPPNLTEEQIIRRYYHLKANRNRYRNPNLIDLNIIACALALGRLV